MAFHNEIGKLGEEIAITFLKKRKFDVFTRNVNKKYGEIDIIAEKQGITHFIEVETVSCEILNSEIINSNKAEENVTREKLNKLSRVISVYISEKTIEKWQFDVIGVYVDIKTKKAKVNFLENQLLSE